MTLTQSTGGPTAAVLALHNPAIKVNVIDKDASRVAAWCSKHLPVHEPGLEEVVRIGRDGLKNEDDADNDVESRGREPNLFFTTDFNRIVDADLVFISVNTPTKLSGFGAGSATDMTTFESAVVAVASYLKSGAIIIEKSTVPCGTAQTISDIVSDFLR